MSKQKEVPEEQSPIENIDLKMLNTLWHLWDMGGNLFEENSQWENEN